MNSYPRMSHYSAQLLEISHIDGGGVGYEYETESLVIGRERVEFETGYCDPFPSQLLLQFLLDLLRRLLAVCVRLHRLVDYLNDILLLLFRRLEALLGCLWCAGWSGHRLLRCLYSLLWWNLTAGTLLTRLWKLGLLRHRLLWWHEWALLLLTRLNTERLRARLNTERLLARLNTERLLARLYEWSGSILLLLWKSGELLLLLTTDGRWEWLLWELWLWLLAGEWLLWWDAKLLLAALLLWKLLTNLLLA